MNQEQLFVPITFSLPFIVRSMNVYLFLGEPLTLLDTGPKTAPAREALEQTLAAHGLCCEQIKRIILTHGHVDHVGLARELAARSGAEIYIHRYDAPKVRKGYSLFQELLPYLRQAGVPQANVDDVQRWCTAADHLQEPVDNVRLLEENDEIVFDSFSLRVIHCPGHSQGHICYYHEASGVLFSGDCVLANITPNPAMETSITQPDRRNQALVEYLGSLKKIDELNVARMYPAHGPIISSPQQRLAQIRRHHQVRKDAVSNLLNHQGSTAYELGRKLFGNSKEADIFLTVSEVLAHLDVLIQEGKAMAEPRDGVICYSAA